MESRHYITTTDNNLGICDLYPQEIEILEHLSDCKLDELKDDCGEEVWIFPEKNKRHNDKIDDEFLFSINENRLVTNNIMGFIGYNGIEINIKSRFTDTDNDDWFMQYMLQKVFSINIFNLEHSRNDQSALDIAAILFPHFLQNAMKQGLYREYTRRDNNDCHLKGSINFNDHFKKNYPFVNGKIAYTTREYVFDNAVTQLIRHTIEFLRQENSMYDIICSTPETVEYIRQIIEATPSYRKRDLTKIIRSNINPRIHPFYSGYLPLQKLCLQILKRQKLGYTEESDKIHGILFDGAWLWETYLNTILSEAGYEHPDNKQKENAIFPFVGRNNKYSRYPDFIKKGIIVDAKYKRSIKEDSQKYYDNIQRDDLNQMIAYMHTTGYKKGIFLTPNDLPPIHQINDTEFKGFLDIGNGFYYYNVGELKGDGGSISILGLDIPQNCKTYIEFKTRITQNENNLRDYMSRI